MCGVFVLDILLERLNGIVAGLELGIFLLDAVRELLQDVITRLEFVVVPFVELSELALDAFGLKLGCAPETLLLIKRSSDTLKLGLVLKSLLEFNAKTR